MAFKTANIAEINRESQSSLVIRTPLGHQDWSDLEIILVESARHSSLTRPY